MVLEKTLESPLDCKEIKPVHPKGNQSWIFLGSTDAEAETPIFWLPDALTHWKRPWCWERLMAEGEGDDRGWDGWMASLTQWTWISVSSGNWWWTGKPGVLQSLGSQRVRHDWATNPYFFLFVFAYQVFMSLYYFFYNPLFHFFLFFLAIKKNSFESVLMRWIKLEPIIQSEVSQKDKDQYSILTHIYGI